MTAGVFFVVGSHGGEENYWRGCVHGEDQDKKLLTGGVGRVGFGGGVQGRNKHAARVSDAGVFRGDDAERRE